LVAALIGVATLAACSEKIDAGAACPLLCPQEPQDVRDTTFFAVAIDTSIPGFPPIGAEPRLLLATMGDTFDARAVVRFDSVPTHYFKPAGGEARITEIDSARLTLHFAAFDTLNTDSVRFEVYDLSALDDTAAAVLLPAFQPANLLGAKSVTFADTAVRADSSVDIPIDSTKILAKFPADTAVRGARLRVGVRITAAASAQVQVFAANTSTTLGPLLSFKPAPDSGVTRLGGTPFSATPAIDQLASDLADFQIVAKAPPPPAADVLRVGGVPGWRTYFRFDIPSAILDSSSVVRATFFLTQHPNPALPEPHDSLALAPYVVSASSAITDLSRMLTFITAPQDSVVLAPADSGAVTMEVVDIVRPWRNTAPDRTPRAIALSSSLEGARAWQVEFYSNEAVDAVRPRLRISYVPQPPQGLP
jgi:hypothetical protein